MTIQEVLNLQRISTNDASKAKSHYGQTFDTSSIESGKYVYYKSDKRIELRDLFIKLENVESEFISDSTFFSTNKSLPKSMLNRAGFKFTSEINNSNAILIVPQTKFPRTCYRFMKMFLYLIFNDLDIIRKVEDLYDGKEYRYYQIPVTISEIIENYSILNLKSAIFFAYDQLEPAKDFSAVKQLLDSDSESNFKLANKLLISQNYTHCFDQIIDYQKLLIYKAKNDRSQNSFWLKELLKIWINTLDLNEYQVFNSTTVVNTINSIVAAYGDKYEILYDGFMNRINKELQNNYSTELIFTSKTTYA